MKIFGQISLGLLLLSTASVVNAQWVPMPTTGLTGDNIITQSVVTVVDGSVEKTMIMNTQGLFEYNPASQTWSQYGTGLEGIPIRSVSFGSLGKYAVSNTFRDAMDVVQGGILYKYDEGSQLWDTIKADVPNTLLDLGIAGIVGNVYQYTQKGKNRVFVTRFGNDTTFGMVYSDDMGVTWNNYNKLTTVGGDTGLFKEGSRVVTNIITSDSEGRLYVSAKNRVQMSFDGGDTWINRIGNYVLNTGNSNIRSMITRNFDGKEYLVITTDETSGGFWTVGYTESNDDAGKVWTGGKPIPQDGNSLVDYAGKYLFTGFRTQTEGPRLSLDNGITWSSFTDNMPLINSSNKIIGISRAGDSLYATFAAAHTTVPNGIYVFNLLDLDAPKVQIQVSENVFGDPVSGAVIEFNGRTLSTNGAGLVTVYGIKDSTDVPIKISKTGLVTIDSIITFGTANPIAIQMRQEPPNSIASYNATESTLYPNPASDMVYLPVGAQNVTVMSASGAPMSVPVAGRLLNVAGLNPGMYIVRTSTGTYKFMKK